MASMPAPSVDGEDDQASESTKNLRLSDAERIAAERLSGADTVPEWQPAEPTMSLPETATVAEPRDAQWQGAAEPAPPAPVGASAAVPAESAAATPPVDVEIARAGPAPGSAEYVAMIAAGDLPAPAAPSLGASAGGRVEPLVSALDAAARLTADATAAAQALENLQRLLQRQLPSITGAPAAAAPRVDADGWPPPAAPPPIPAPPLHEVGEHARLPGHGDQLPPPDPARPMPQERRRFDIRGFLAGFALSWAFGVVLYLFMTAG